MDHKLKHQFFDSLGGDYTVLETFLTGYEENSMIVILPTKLIEDTDKDLIHKVYDAIADLMD